MNKADVVSRVAEKCGMSNKEAKVAVNAVLDTIKEGVTSGEGVFLVGFGSMSVSHKSARMGRNPQTGKTLEIPAKNVVKFKPSKAMADAVLDLKL